MSRDFVNDGECIVCGHLKDKIEAGEAKPCIEWETIKPKEDEDNGPDEA
jgi:hypothetical protein